MARNSDGQIMIQSFPSQIEDFMKTVLYNDFKELVNEELENTREFLEDPRMSDSDDIKTLDFYRGQIHQLKLTKIYFEEMLEQRKAQDEDEE